MDQSGDTSNTSGDGGGGQNTTQTGGGTPPATGTPPAPPAVTQQAPTGQQQAPQPVPYTVFKQTNDALRTAQEQISTLQAQLRSHGPEAVSTLQQQLQQQQAEAQVRIALARAGVATDAGMDYLASRYQGLPEQGRPDLGAWLEQIRSSEPAFFRTATAPAVADTGSAGATAPTQETTTIAAPAGPSSPEATTQPSSAPTTATDAPLSEEVIRSMSQQEFERRYDEIEKWYAAAARRA